MSSVLAWFKGILPASPTDPAELAQRRRLTYWRTGTLAVLAVTLWIAMAEVDRLIADSATSTGRSASASSLQALDPRLGQENWGLWLSLTEDIRQQVCGLLLIYSGLDAIFAVLYITLLYGFFSSRIMARLAVGAVAAGELAELILQAQGIRQLRLGILPEFLGSALIASSVKWVGLAALVLFVFVYPSFRTSVRNCLRRAWRALFFHRISVAMIVVIGALALVPIPGVNDQMPDTQRAWVDAGSNKFVVTSCAALLVSGGLFYLGRRRSELAWSLYFAVPDPPNDAPKYWMWALPPALLGLAIVFVMMTTGLIVPLSGQTWVAAVVPLAVSLLSFLLVGVSGPGAPIAPRPPDPLRAMDIWRCGDVLAIVLLAISGMALVRAFAAPLALGLVGAVDFDGSLWASVRYFMVGLLIVALAFPVGAFLVRCLWGGILDPRVIAGATTKKVTVIVALVFTGLGFAFAMNPVALSKFAGVPGTALLTMGAWAMVIGLSVVALQRQVPLQLFKRMGLRANPVISLLVVVLAVGSLNGGNPVLHHVREKDAAAAIEAGLVDRPSLAEAFDSWLQRDTDCGIDVMSADGTKGAHQVRPMLLVAAEGGGIRAASWTARALEKLSSAGACGSNSVLVSSGVSGGSFGLTLSRLYGHDAVATMETLAQPGPLGAAVAGAMVGDIVASGTGLMIPTRFKDPVTGVENVAWNDRAGLVESLWEESAGKLAQSFDPTIAGPTGALVLNSTDTGTGCRVVISQIDLPSARDTQNAGPPNGLSCVAGQGFPLSVDLFDQQAQCPLELRWSTATLLSGRFPIISPAGRAPAVTASPGEGPQCRMQQGFQLIDGGYSEGSALGTISDLWPTLQAEIIGHNACVLAAAARPAGQEVAAEDPCAGVDATADLIVPIFLFLQNSPGADIVGQPPQAAGELAVPLAGLKAAKLQSGSAAWIQRLEAGAVACPSTLASNDCVNATARVRAALGDRSVVVVATNSVPALAAPLGWSLSNMSQRQLAEAMDQEALVTKDDADMQSFAKLLAFLRG
ncbi:hypothetical protein MB46_13765 [Arthrobacter alpinus]|uniref:hypothetical protein n=1 Tax=Arthrobacter alpinus TaxID=656366 RepID=UPI0005CA2C27|nr:hypothetical protein [Arthrobacter alpinus]ALV46393.1 hypothetical protein MB46_13765 [Arthrobacter alpinus]